MARKDDQIPVSIFLNFVNLLIGKVRVIIDSYVNKQNTAVTVEFHWEIIKPLCTLRVIDRFVINDEGKIIEQENFFDPRDVTHPGTKQVWKGDGPM